MSILAQNGGKEGQELVGPTTQKAEPLTCATRSSCCGFRWGLNWVIIMAPDDQKKVEMNASCVNPKQSIHQERCFFPASIMSKKAAEGIDALVLEVTFGKAAPMKTEKDARELARIMVHRKYTSRVCKSKRKFSIRDKLDTSRHLSKRTSFETRSFQQQKFTGNDHAR